MRKILLLILLLTGFAVTAFAQADPQAPTGEAEPQKSYLYQWSDDSGVHISDSLEKVPMQYRDKAIKMTQEKTEGVDQGQQMQQRPVTPSGAGSEAAEAAEKAVWQQRMRQAKERLANAEMRYADLDQRRKELLRRSTVGAFGGQEVIEAQNIELQMKDAQKEIDNARNDVEVVIPDEARKQGIPPGWLRE